MARKPWGELSPAYRARLERHGITAQKHAAGAPVAAAGGHGAQTPHVRKAVLHRAAQSASRLFKRAKALGVTDTQLTAAIVAGGTYRAQLGLDFREYRRDLWLASDKAKTGKDMPTFEQYVRDLYGDAYWEDNDWEDFAELDWLGYYHD